MVHWLSRREIFGTKNNRDRHHAASWCIAQILRLLQQRPPLVENPIYQAEFKLAELLEQSYYPENPEEKLIKLLPLEKALDNLGMPPEWSRIMLYLLTFDHQKRPRARDALKLLLIAEHSNTLKNIYNFSPSSYCSLTACLPMISKSPCLLPSTKGTPSPVSSLMKLAFPLTRFTIM